MTSLKTPSKLPWILLWAYSALILKGALLSAEDLPRFFSFLNDKLVHGSEYFLLLPLAWWAFRFSSRAWLNRRSMAWAFRYCLFLGILTECVQIGSATRTASLDDFAADALGASLSFLLIILIRKGKRE